jgi:hypothetical protein
MFWFLLFLALAIAGGIVLGWFAWRLWLKARACYSAISSAGERLAGTFPASDRKLDDTAYHRFD